MSVRSLKDAVRSGNAGLLIIGVILLVVALRFAERQFIFFTLWRATPTAVTPEALANADPDTLIRRVVLVQVRTPQDVGRLVRENDEGRITGTAAGFYLVDVGDRKALLISARRQLPADTLIHAMIFRISAEQRRVLLDPLTRDGAALRGALLPFSLTLTLAAQPMPWKFFLAVAFVLAAAGLVLRMILQRLDHRSHPIFATLATFGDPARIEAEIDRELAQGVGAFDGLSLLSQYIVIHDGSADVLRYDDVVWLYGETSEKHGRFHEGKVCLETVDGRQVKATVKAYDDMQRALTHLAARAPWALVGFSDENERRLRGAERAATVAQILKTRDHNLNRT